MSLDNKSLYKTIKYLNSGKFGQWNDLANFIQDVNSANPYHPKDSRSIMWREQCYVNFPILYLMSIYLYFFAKERDCTTFLFATRDCCHLHRIFEKLFPGRDVNYFHCSRLMFEKATSEGNPDFKIYVRSMVKDIDRTIFVDLHGTGKRALNYFEKEFNRVPYCFLLSNGSSDITGLPAISQKYALEGKLFNLVCNAKGTPIEMLNYDLKGTLVNYSSLVGPVRDNLEYCEHRIEPYHKCIDFILQRLEFTPPANFTSEEVINLINKIFKSIQEDRPSIARYIEHISRHKEICTNISEQLVNNLSFNEVMNNSGVYGVIWDGLLDNRHVAIKMVALTSDYNDKRNFHQCQSKPFIDNLFDNHKRMSVNDFLYEANELVKLSHINLAPLVYGFWTCTEIYKNNYGFIVMDKMDSSLKDVLMKRDLSDREVRLIESRINQIHSKGIIHGDLKPSNIGLTLSPDGEIMECRFIDTQKIKHQKNFTSKQFQQSVKRDWEIYYKHYKQNRDM
ncbi:hypothetical protein BH23THE1_BH23THE1_33250 [soil metagenome]